MNGPFRIFALLGAIWAVCGTACADSIPESADAVGRYQMAAVPDGRIVVIDTVTGQCWSKKDGAWHDEGNPTRREAAPKAEEEGARPARAQLSDSLVMLMIPQRQSKAIPGSRGSLQIRLGDITGEHVAVSVVTTDGDRLVDESMAEGDSASFDVQSKPYVVGVRHLDNQLAGDDLATVVVVPKTWQDDSLLQEGGNGSDKEKDSKSERFTVKVGESFESNLESTYEILEVRNGSVIMREEGKGFDFSMREGRIVWLNPVESLKLVAIADDEESVTLSLDFPTAPQNPFGF